MQLMPKSGPCDLLRASEMEVLCACDDRYLPHAATMLCSLLEHNNVLQIHFFYRSIPASQLTRLNSLVARYGCKIAFYEIGATEFEDLRVDKWASMAVYYRLLAPRLLPANLNKVLYLDCDIIVRRSLEELWNTDIADHALAAVPNNDQDDGRILRLPTGAKYFNSGVLLINLQFWRQYNVPETAISFVRENPDKVQYWDQDALNATFIDQWVELPSRWNAQIDKWHPLGPGAEKDLAIVHFITEDKPWHWANKHPFKGEYHHYRFKTPWWRYQPVGRPTLLQRFGRTLRNFVRLVLPLRLRQWFRLHLMSSRT